MDATIAALAVELLVGAIVLRAVAGVTTDLEVANWGAALGGAFAVVLAGWLLDTVATNALQSVLPPMTLTGAWEYGDMGHLVLLLGVNTLALAGAALVMPGLTCRGFVAVLVAGVLLTAAALVAPVLVAQLGLVPVGPSQ